jgi:hypothetical protein
VILSIITSTASILGDNFLCSIRNDEPTTKQLNLVINQISDDFPEDDEEEEDAETENSSTDVSSRSSTFTPKRRLPQVTFSFQVSPPPMPDAPVLAPPLSLTFPLPEVQLLHHTYQNTQAVMTFGDGIDDDMYDLNSNRSSFEVLCFTQSSGDQRASAEEMSSSSPGRRLIRRDTDVPEIDITEFRSPDHSPVVAPAHMSASPTYSSDHSHSIVFVDNTSSFQTPTTTFTTCGSPPTSTVGATQYMLQAMAIPPPPPPSPTSHLLPPSCRIVRPAIDAFDLAAVLARVSTVSSSEAIDAGIEFPVVEHMF